MNTITINAAGDITSMIPVSNATISVDCKTAVRQAMDCFDRINAAVTSSQGAMMNVLRAMSTMGPKLIKESADLIMLFGREFRGIDRRRLVTWVETFSPVRVRFEETGRFKDLAWSAGHVKQCKESGREVFDLEGADAMNWWDCEESAKGVSFKSKTASSLANTLIRQAAKSAVLESDAGMGFDLKVLESILKEVVQHISKKGNLEALEYACTPGFGLWEIGAIAHKEKMLRHAGQDVDSKRREREAKLAALIKEMEEDA